MNYELAKKLKDSGFPVRLVIGASEWDGDKVFFDGTMSNDGQKIGFLPPTLEELVEACGDIIHCVVSGGKTPVEATAILWLQLKTLHNAPQAP